MSVFAEFLAPVTAHPLGEFLADYPGVSVEVERTVPTGGSTRYVWIAGEGHDDLVDEIQEDPPVDALATVDDLPDRELLRFEWSNDEPRIFQLVEDVDATLVGVRGTHEGWTVRIRFPEQDALTTFFQTCQERGVPIQLRQIYEPDDGADDSEYGVTAAQYETLAKAFEAGYFDIPRGVTLTELADQLGVSQQAVSERLRRGVSSFLTSIDFDDRSTDSTENGPAD